MKIVTLVENTKGRKECQAEHGLSLYMETEKHKLLLDTGASDAMLRNAEQLGVDLTQVDTVILSHGHYDHSGGLLAFAQINPGAKIWMQEKALDAYYHVNKETERYIGVDPAVRELAGVKLLKGNYRIDEELFLFTGVKGRKLWPAGNRELMVKRENGFCQDTFAHEQYLVIEENGKRILLSGCAHNGILNIMESYKELSGQEPDVIISGFHTRRKSGYSQEDLAVIRQMGQALSGTKTMIYTGHCTGEEPFAVLKEMLGEQLCYLHCGDELFI